MDTLHPVRRASGASSLLLACHLLAAPAVVVAADRPPPLVMLANVYADAGDRIDLSDYWVSEKYDGIRGYWDGRALVTREGNIVHAPDWFVAGWPSVPLDGELWIGRGAFEALSSIVRDVRPSDRDWRQVRFMVFDLPAYPGSFTQRLAALRQLVAAQPSPWLRLAPQIKVADQAALHAELDDVIARGGEGLMLHRGGSPYRGGRSDDLLKLKPYRDAEAQVVGVLPGHGKYQGMLGALLVQRPDGVRFRLGSGFTDAERRRPPPIGTWVTYRYQGLTDNGIPRFARFVRVYEPAVPVKRP
jgi:DNA ligase-1